MKLGKEIKLDLLDNYKTKIGTVNNKESKSLYINLCAWGQLSELDENLNYGYYLRNVRKKIKQKLNNSLNKDLFHNHKYIVDLDMRTSGLSVEKRSFMSCEITLFQKKYLPLNKPRIVDNTKEIIKDVVTDCLENNSIFTFHRTKK
tara:strand:+ start:6727 stop:7164 length:438 start_codon:yes stop_codon:yes gene_type:complete